MKKLFLSLLMFVVVSPVFAQDQGSMTIAEFVKINEGFSTLAAALEATELGNLLAGEGPFTFFAPTDEAFAAMPQGRREALLKNPNAMRALLRRHILDDKVLASELTSRGKVRNEEGSDLSFSTRGDGTVVVNKAAAVVGADVGISTGIQLSNGVIHIIDTVLQK